MITPCVKKCALVKQQCIGCKRTTQEIANWQYYTEQERKDIIKELKHR